MGNVGFALCDAMKSLRRDPSERLKKPTLTAETAENAEKT
jgi:hypothetical protein